MTALTHSTPDRAHLASPRGTAYVRPLVTVIVPVFNEQDHLQRNSERLLTYLESIDDRYHCEVLFVNDGSSDDSPRILERLEQVDERVRVIHHNRNRGLCEGMKTGFANCRGTYAVTIDSDLSYSPDHIGRLLDHIVKTGAEVVLASPYMKGGESINVPKDRLRASRWANWFLSKVSPENLSTFTGMVRAYDVNFLKSLDLKSKGMDVNPELIYKTLLLRGRVEEIPARLDWTELVGEDGAPRRTSFAVPWHTLAILFSGFVFRPFIFFFVPGVALGITALVAAAMTVAHMVGHALEATGGSFLGRLWWSFTGTFEEHSYAYFTTALLTVMAIQLLSLGFLSMQSKRYFEEIFHLGTSVHRRQLEKKNLD